MPEISGDTRERRFRAIRLLFVLPFLALIDVPYYNRVEPVLGGVPFFYWYQMLWVLIGAGLAGLVYAVERGADR